MKLATEPTLKFLEVLAWALLVFLGASSMRAFRPLPLDNDSYQYLNVAENLKPWSWADYVAHLLRYGTISWSHPWAAYVVAAWVPGRDCDYKSSRG